MDNQIEPSSELLEDERHQVHLHTDPQNGDVFLECTSRLALREFALSLLSEANSGTGWNEYYPLGSEGKALVVNGARFAIQSSRLFVSYPSNHQDFEEQPRSTS